MFFDNYQTLCIKKGVSPSAAAREIGVNPSSYTGWSKGSLPRMATVRKIADYFGVTTDDLMNSDNIAERYEIAQTLREMNERNPERKKKAIEQILSFYDVSTSSEDQPMKQVRTETSEEEQALIDMLRKASAVKRLKAYAAAIKALTEDEE